MIQTLTLDDVVRGVTQNHLEDDMHIGAIDAELLRRVYKNLDDCQHIQYNVFAADEFGTGVNQLKLRKNATARELLAEAPADPPAVILKEDLSPKLMHGDIVMGVHPSSFIALGQVEMDKIATTGYASVRVLTPHAHRIDDSIMVRQHLEKVYKQKKGLDKDSPPMVEMQISDDDPRMLNIPKEQADIQPYFWRDEQWIALYEANDLSIYELVEKSPVDQAAKDALADLLVKHYFDEWELHGEEVGVLHEAYRDELNKTAKEGARKESPTGGAPHDYASAQKFLQDHVRVIHTGRGGLER